MTFSLSSPRAGRTTTLGDACARSGGDVQTGPFGSQLHAADYVPEGIPSIMPKNIGENRVIEEDIARITSDDAERLARYRVRTGDIVYSRRGDVERRALIRDREDGWLCGTGCLRVRFVPNGGVDPVYASYYLAHPRVREWISWHAHGATMPNLNTAILSSLPFLVPPIDDQRSVARLLGTFDGKIDANRRMNRTLDDIARATFKSWFVDLEPVRAKIDGRQTGLPPHLDALFPESFEDSDLGDIPAGWRVAPIGEVVSVVGGSTPGTKVPEFWDGSHAFATPKDLSRLSSPILLDTARRITDAGLGKIASGLLPSDAVLMSSRAPVLKRVCALHVPIPYSPSLEDHVFPNAEKIAAGVRAVLAEPA